MDTTKHIKELLELYFEGETSLEQEQELKVYFTEGTVANELKAYQGLFQFLVTEKDITLPQKRSTKIVALAPKSIETVSKSRKMYFYLTRVAAVLLIAVSAYLLIPNAEKEQKQAINWEQYEVQDEAEAIEKTIAALRLVSSKLNSSTKKAVKEVRHVQAAAKIFKK